MLTITDGVIRTGTVTEEDKLLVLTELLDQRKELNDRIDIVL